MQGKAAGLPRPAPGAYQANGVLHHLVRHLLRIHAVGPFLHLLPEQVDPFLAGRLLPSRHRPVPLFPACTRTVHWKAPLAGIRIKIISARSRKTFPDTERLTFRPATAGG